MAAFIFSSQESTKMRAIKVHIFLYVLALVSLIGCAPKGDATQETEKKKEMVEKTTPSRIVSTNGTLSEIIVELGLEDNLVGVDVTSVYPESLKQKKSIGHNRSMSAEGIIALNPEVVVGIEGSLNDELVNQIKATGIDVMLFKHEFTKSGAIQLVDDVAEALSKKEEGQAIHNKIVQDFEKVSGDSLDLKVLFLYARGAGTLMAFGSDTQGDALIKMTGAQNAVTAYDGCKNLTAEALVEANPDVVVMFESGLNSLNGVEGVLDVPGMKQTNAGKNKAFVAMNGLYLLGFGPRSGMAVNELNNRLKSYLKTSI